MNKATELQLKIDVLTAELHRLPAFETMTVREFASRASISQATAGRIKNGEIGNMGLDTVHKVLPFMMQCPCCFTMVDPETFETSDKDGEGD